MFECDGDEEMQDKAGTRGGNLHISCWKADGRLDKDGGKKDQNGVEELGKKKQKKWGKKAEKCIGKK